MWGKKKPNQKPVTNSRFDTLISTKTQVTGDILFSGGLHVDGKVAGAIRADDGGDAVVRISDSGVVEGDVIAPHVVINGRVNGDVHASKHIELAAKASVQGTVYYNLIEMEMGAEVNGSLVHVKEPEQAPAVTLKSAPVKQAAKGSSNDDAVAEALSDAPAVSLTKSG